MPLDEEKEMTEVQNKDENPKEKGTLTSEKI